MNKTNGSETFIYFAHKSSLSEGSVSASWLSSFYQTSFQPFFLFGLQKKWIFQFILNFVYSLVSDVQAFFKIYMKALYIRLHLIFVSLFIWQNENLSILYQTSNIAIQDLFIHWTIPFIKSLFFNLFWRKSVIGGSNFAHGGSDRLPFQSFHQP